MTAEPVEDHRLLDALPEHARMTWQTPLIEAQRVERAESRLSVMQRNRGLRVQERSFGLGAASAGA